MGTRNNPSPGGLRQGLETSTRRTRTRKQPVRVSKMSNVSNASESDGEVATMTVPQPQTKQPPSTFEPPTSSSHPPSEQVLESVEAAEPRSIAPLPQRRHNTRSSRSVSPSLALSLDNIDRSQNPKTKGKGRARSTSASSTHQGVEAATARGGKRKVNSNDADDIERATTKRTKDVHRGPITTKKRNLRGKPPGSPIVEADEEDEDTGNVFRRSIKRAKNVLTIPRAELEFSYVHVGTPPAPVDEQAQGPNGGPSSSRTPNSTSIDPTTPTPMQAPAQAGSSQRSVAKPEEIAEQRAVWNTPILSTPAQPTTQITDSQSSPPTAEQGASRGTPTVSTPKQPVIERTGAQSNSRRSDAQDADQELSVQRHRSNNTTPLATTSTTPVAVGSSSNSNGSPVLRQGLTDTRVTQGSARVQRNSNSYLQTSRGSSRLRDLHPPRKTPLTMGSVEIYEDSEHEDDDDQNPWTVEEFKGWKSDLRTARYAFESVLAGERLPEPEPSINAQEKRITRRKLGQTPPASRPHKLRAVFDWTQSSRKNVLPPAETLIAFLDAHVRSAAPSPASPQAITQPSSTKSTPLPEEHSSPQNTSNQSGAASPSTSTGGSAFSPSEAKQSAQGNESDSESLNNEPKNNMMSPTASDADDTQELLTTPIQTPSQPASEPRAWPSTIMKSMKSVRDVVASPFKFFGRTPKIGSAATTNEAEFTFTHPQQLPQPVTTPTRSSKQHVKPQSEQRVVSNQQSQISSPTRVPQTERRRRQTDKTPVRLRGASSSTTILSSNNYQAATRQQRQAKKTPIHLRGASPATTRPKSNNDEAATSQQEQTKKTPIHLRGVVVPESTMKELHDEQAATRQQHREAETARVEAEENEDSRKGKSFKAPDPNAPDSDDEDTTISIDADSDDGANEAPGSKQATETKSQRLDRLFRTRQPPLAVQANLYPGRCVRFKDDYDPSVVRRNWALTDALQLCQPGQQLNYTNRVTELDPDDPTNPYYFVRDPSRRGQYYRMVNINEPDWICMNAFGEEALFYMVPGGLNGETYWEIQHGGEVTLRNGVTKLAWANWLNNPANKEKEKDRLMAKWNSFPESKKAALLPGLPKHLKTIMGMGSLEQSQECPAWRCGDTSLEKYEHYRIYEADKSTSCETESGGWNIKVPSPGPSDDEDDEVEVEEVQTRPARAPVQTPQIPSTPTPPPKPRPGNAQLPQPLPANTTLANTNQYRQKAENALLHGPSKLRNVTQMSPLQQDQESDKENRVKVNGSSETSTEEAEKEAKTKEVYDFLRTLNAQGKILPAPLPKAKVMDIQLPPGYPGTYSEYREEINSAVKAAFDKNNAGMHVSEES